MKILHTVQLYDPSVGGMQEVVKQLSERLVRLGHEVHVATTALSARKQGVINGVQIHNFAIGGNAVHGISGDSAAYVDFVLNGRFDVVVNFAAQQWATDLLLPVLDRIKAIKIFVPTGFSGLYDPAYGQYFQQMRTWLGQYDMNVFLSDSYRDIDFARKYGIQNRLIIPNGASEDEFLSAQPDLQAQVKKDLGISPDNLLILSVGSHTGLKGHAEAIRIFKKAKINNATLLIVGNDTGGGCSKSCRRQEYFFAKMFWQQNKGKQLLVRELSRRQTVALYQAADLFLFTSNVECSPLVLFEAMAAKTPFLTTDVGNAAEIISWSQGGVLLPTTFDKKGDSRADIQQGVRLLTELAHNSSKRKELSAAGFAAWQKRFSWQKITKQYEDLYRSLLAKRKV